MFLLCKSNILTLVAVILTSLAGYFCKLFFVFAALLGIISACVGEQRLCKKFCIFLINYTAMCQKKLLPFLQNLIDVLIALCIL